MIENPPMSAKNEMLRHFLAALAYRTQKALRDAPSDFGDFDAGGRSSQLAVRGSQLAVRRS